MEDRCRLCSGSDPHVEGSCYCCDNMPDQYTLACRVAELEDIVADRTKDVAHLTARAEKAEAEAERLRVLLESQGRDHTQPCSLGTLCPWCYAEQLRSERGGLEAQLAAVKGNPVFKFLLGEGPLNGCHFSERPDGERGNYWWRKHLRAALVGVEVPVTRRKEG